jgi:chromate transport protein ChrA
MATVEKEETAAREAVEHGLPFSEALKVWAQMAALSFGGPAGQITVMHRIIGEERFLHALFFGLKSAVLAIVLGAVLRIGSLAPRQIWPLARRGTRLLSGFRAIHRGAMLLF